MNITEFCWESMLSTRLANCLRNNFNTVEEVAASTDFELLRMDNFGRVSLRELRVLIPFDYELAESKSQKEKAKRQERADRIDDEMRIVGLLQELHQ